MQFDILAAIEITAGAALVSATLAIGLGKTAGARRGWAVGFGAWFAAAAIVGATGALNHPGAAGLAVLVVAPIVAYFAASLWCDKFRLAVRDIPLAWLIGVNVVRLFGVKFVLLYAAGRLPAPFAPAAGWGDFFVGLTALPVVWLVRAKGAGARPVVGVWNAVALADLVTAIGLGVASSPGPARLIFAPPGTALMKTLPWLLIPGFMVPLFACTHLAVFKRLAGFRSEPVSRPAEGSGCDRRMSLPAH